MRIECKWYLAELNRAIEEGTQNALTKGLEIILEEASKKVPHDTGELQASGDIEVDASNKEGQVYYISPKAVRLHEHPEYNFQNGREGKWLEKAIDQNINLIRDKMQEEVAKALKG